MANKQAHQKVANTLMRDIFFHKIKPGERLSSERELSISMNVDRTSLRVALKQLESMELLDIRPGDGIYVKDFLKHAGIDFLRALFSQKDTLEDGLAVDMFMIDEAWEWWIIFFPDMIKLAATRASSRDLKKMSILFDRELECINQRDKLIEIWMDQQELIASTINNMVLMLMFNSSRPLRRNMLRIFMECVEQEDLERFVFSKKNLVVNFLMNCGRDINLDVEQYREILIAQRQIIRNKLIKDTVSSDKIRLQQ